MRDWLPTHGFEPLAVLIVGAIFVCALPVLLVERAGKRLARRR